MASFTTAALPSLEGRTYVITGANGGNGRATATVLAAKGARVVLAVRNAGKGGIAAAEMGGDNHRTLRQPRRKDYRHVS